MRSGRLIVIEGIDGSGKSTLARGLAERVRALGRDVVLTREPTDGPYGRKIRELAATGQRATITPQEEFELFHADRVQHVASLVEPSIAEGKVVIQDRSYFSTMAYQGQRGIPLQTIRTRSEEVVPPPDLLLVVDVEVDEALERIRQNRGVSRDDFEARSSLRFAREVFLGLEGGIVLEGRLTPDLLVDRAMEHVTPLLSAPLPH